MVFDLKSKPEPPIQMYSAIVVSFSAGRLLNLVVNLAKLDSIFVNSESDYFNY